MGGQEGQGKGAYLFGGNVTSQQQPDQPLRGWFTCTGWASEGGQCFLQIWDGVAAEADALIGVQQRGLPEHALDAARAPDALINRHLQQDNALESEAGGNQQHAKC